MIVHFYKVDVENVINNEFMVYAQIPFVKHNYFDFDSETDHLITLEVDKEKAISEFYYEGYYPFYRHKDLDTFQKLLLELDSE